MKSFKNRFEKDYKIIDILLQRSSKSSLIGLCLREKEVDKLILTHIDYIILLYRALTYTPI